MKSLQLFVILLLISFILFILFQLEWVETKEGLTNRTITHEVPMCQLQATAKPPPCFATLQTDEYIGNSDFIKDEYIGNSDFIKDDYILKTKIVTPVCPNDPFNPTYQNTDGSVSHDINPAMFNEENLSSLFNLASNIAVAGNKWLSDPTNTDYLERSIPGVTEVVKNVINITGLTSNTDNTSNTGNTSNTDLSLNTIVNITKNIWDNSTNLVQNDSFPFIQSENNQPQPSNTPTPSVTERSIPTLPPIDNIGNISTPQKPVEPEPAQASETSSPSKASGTSSPSHIYRVPTGSPPTGSLIDKPPLGNPPWYSCNRTNDSMDPVPLNDDFTRFTQI